MTARPHYYGAALFVRRDRAKVCSMDIKDKTVVLTGALSGMTRKEAAVALEAIGANVLSSVTKKTDIVFYGDKPGSKLSKAESYGIPVYEESVLLELLEQAGQDERR